MQSIHKVGNYMFDSERLIFYRSNLDSKMIEHINDCNMKYDRTKIDYFFENNDFCNLNAKKKFPTHGVICLTNNCQLRCNYCNHSSVESDNCNLSPDKAIVFVKFLIKNSLMKKVVAESNKGIKLVFTGGGEPTYDWSLFVNVVTSVVDLCNRNNVELELTLSTNGILNDSQRDFIGKTFHEVMISFDGLPHIHDKNRFSEKYKNASAITEKTIEYMRKFNISVHLRTTLWQEDLKYLNDMANYIYSKYDFIDSWIMFPPYNRGRAAKISKQDHYEENEYNYFEYHLKLVKFIEENFENNKIVALLYGINSHVYNESFCGSHSISNPALLPNGDITTCMDLSKDLPIIGYVSDASVEMSEDYCDSIMKMSKIKYYECKDCIAYPFCTGGCPIKFIADLDNEVKTSSWECKMITNYWEHVFSRILEGEICFDWYTEKIVLPQHENIHVYKMKKVGTTD